MQSSTLGSIAVAQQPLLLTAPITLGLGLALVVVFLALGGRNLQLHQTTVVKIHHQWHKGHALAFGRIPQAGQLAPADQELALAPFLMGKHCAVIGGDIGIGQPKFAVVNTCIAVRDIGLARAQGFDLGAGQDDTDLEIILDGIIIARTPIIGDDFVVFVFGFLGHSCAQIGDGALRYKVLRVCRNRRKQMFVQIALGSTLLVFSIMTAGISFWVLERRLSSLRSWLLQAPHAPKLMLVLCATALWVLLQMTVAVWAWAFTFMALGVFATLEPSVYFALVAFTTLGFGDILLPIEWRLLGGMAALNGLLNIGLVTAAMVETLRQLRLQQIAIQDRDT